MNGRAEDIELIERIRKNDQEAFMVLYEKYKNNLNSFLLKLTGDPDLAEDILQDTFVKVIFFRKLKIKPFLEALYAFFINISISCNSKIFNAPLDI